MNIRRLGSSQQLITQPAHAALAARIMGQRQPSHFPDSSRKGSFCNNWTNTPDDGSGDSMRLDGTVLTIVPDPFSGRVIEITIEAREIPNQRFASADDARTIRAAAPVVTLHGSVQGSAV